MNPHAARGRTSVLVTDAETRPALAVVRSLGRQGHEVQVCSFRRSPLAAASRYAAGTHVVSNPLANPQRYVEDLARVVRETGVAYVMPITDSSSTALLPHREALAPALVLGPSAASFLAASDKAGLLALAPQFGIAVPPQTRLDARSAALPPTLSFPLVVKPHRSASGGQSLTVRHAHDGATLAAIIDALPDAAFPVLLQQRIIGPGIGIFVLRHADQIIATFAHRRLVEQPASGGGSAYSESVAADEVLVAQVSALLAHLDWEGPAMVEFKVEAATNRAYLMEINGRFWGSLQLAIDSGVDFPAIWLEHVLDPALTPTAVPYRTGVRVRSMTNLVDHVADRLLHTPERLSVPPDAPPLGWVIGQLVRWHPQNRFETLRSDDPMPFLRDIAQWFQRRVLRRY